MKPRLALVGAFIHPAPQGSQVFAGDQARALVAAGAEVELFCYGHGAGPDAPGFPTRRIPKRLSPRRVRAGATPRKPVADAALVALLVRAARRSRPDAVLAHNAEAALCAIAARARTGVPVIYVAHTLWRHELPTYAGPAWAAVLARAGAAIDRVTAARADAVIALSESAAAALGDFARGPVEALPPGLDPEPPPHPDAIRSACARHGLEPGAYVLYAGNLDRYQHLELLAEAARAAALPVVVATHERGRSAPPPLGTLRVEEGETRPLVFGAAACALPRGVHGGFPVKLLNYMEAGRPIVARRGVAEGLVHERSALLVDDDAGPEAWAAALGRIVGDADLAARLGEGAAAVLASRHAWPDLAERTLDLARRVAA